MPLFSEDDLAAWTGGRWTGRPAGIRGFSTDTRELLPGEMFVALRTERRDGRDFLGAALRAGAAAALVDAPDPAVPLAQLAVGDPLAAFQAIARGHRRRFRGPVVGITGSAGKTSTKELLALLLGPGVLATRDNLNNHLGVPLTLARLDPSSHRFAVVEAGISLPGEMAVLAAMIEPDVAIVTLVAPAHLAGLGGIGDVAREKAGLPAAVRLGGVAVFHGECRDFEAFRTLRTPVLDVRFSISHGAGATEVRLPEGAFRLPRVSEGMARNAALALATALHLGEGPGPIRERLARWRPPHLRGEVRREDGRLLYLDCYNANPSSMADALSAFCALAPEGEPRLFVLGCMEELGAEAVRFHRELGRALPLRAGDSAVVIGGNAASVLAGAVEGGSPGRIEAAGSAEDVAARVAGFRGSVFVKGSRRHQLERVVGEAVHA